MSFFLKPFHRKTVSKTSKNSGQVRRASYSSDSAIPSSLALASVYEANEDDTVDISTSTGYGNERMVTSDQQNRQQKLIDKKKPKTVVPRGFIGRDNVNKDDNRRRKTHRSGADEKLASDLKELVEIESFVKKMAASHKGEKLLKEHLKKRQANVGGRHF